MSRRWIVSIAVGIVLIAAGMPLFLPDDIANYPPKGGPIVAFGDSLVAGVGSTPGNDFVSILSREIGEPVENLGLAGNTTEMAFERIG